METKDVEPLVIKIPGTDLIIYRDFFSPDKFKLSRGANGYDYNRTLNRFVYDYREFLPDDYLFDSVEEAQKAAEEWRKNVAI